MIRAVVVDDEYSNRALIKNLISEGSPDFEIVGEADSVATAYEIITKELPQVVFLDIRMPDGNGFDLLDLFKEVNFEVVFISGFDSYALKAFEFNALDYVLKPIDPEKFNRTLKKTIASVGRHGIHGTELKTALQSYDRTQLIMTKIPIHTGGRVILLNIEDIIYLKAEDGCTVFTVGDGERFYSSKQISDFEFIFDSQSAFVKVNKGAVINVNHIKSYSKGIACFIYMKDGSELEVSRRKKGEILELLDQNKNSMQK